MLYFRSKSYQWLNIYKDTTALVLKYFLVVLVKLSKSQGLKLIMVITKGIDNIQVAP
jgi:hypothetical protein